MLPCAQYLQLNGNAVSGILPPEWVGMTAVQQLLLSNNHLSGSIPPTWPANLAAMVSLDVSNNTLMCGLVPSE